MDGPDQKLKVAFVCQPWDSFVPPVESGSLAIWIYQVIQRMKEFGEFTIYSKKKNKLPRREISEGMFCCRVPVGLDLWMNKIIRRIPSTVNEGKPFFSSVLYHLPYILKVARDLRRQNIDIVHVMNFSQFVPIIRKFNPQTKIVLNMHCDWLTQLPRKLIEPRLRQTDMIIGCSNYVTDRIRQKYPDCADRCSTVYNGVDLDQFKSGLGCARRDDEIRLIYVGRISPEKGIHVLLDAFERVVQRYPKAVLEIVGPAGTAPIDFIVNISNEEKVRGLGMYYREDYFKYLKNRLPANIATQVRFIGFVPNDRLKDHYSNADILINPSFSESFGMSLIEAMACGLAVVASRVGGMPEIVDEGKTGVLVESGNVKELSEAICGLIQSESRRRAMGRAGQDRVTRLFPWDNVVEKLHDTYMRVYSTA